MTGKRTHKQDVAKYVTAIIAGKIVASRWVRMACERYMADLRQAKRKGWRFDEDRANNVIEFMQQLVHTKGKWAGKPFLLSPLQKFIVWQLFGWLVAATGLRRFLSVYITVARKWGKSTFAAALAIVLLFFDTPIEAEAEGYVAATMEAQAARIVTQADKMIRANPVLGEMVSSFRWRELVKSIVLEDRPYCGSFIKAMGSDATTADSLNPHFVIKDEVHAWKEHHRELKEKLETGSGSRSQPVDITITTAGSDQSLIWIEQDEYCQKVLESSLVGDCIDETALVIICRIDESHPCDCGGAKPDCRLCRRKCCKSKSCQDCKGKGHFASGETIADSMLDEKVWPKANPDIGTTPSWKYMRTLANKAKHSPAFRNAFHRYHANGKVRSSAKVINPKVWARCKGKLSKWRGNSRGAWDVGLRDDLASIAACNDERGSKFELRQLSFCPEDGPRDLTKPPWPRFIEEGLLIVTPGDTTDFNLMKSYIVDWTKRYGITDWAFDRAHSRQMASDIQDDHGIEVFEFEQSYKMFNEPMREMVRLIKSRNIIHDGDELLAWAAGNLVAKIGAAGEWKPDKLKSPEKIDPMVASIMCFGRCLLGEKPKKSVYNSRGVITG